MSSRIYLRPPEISDQDEILAAARNSRSLHRPWIVAPETPAQFSAYLERMAQLASAPFLVCRRDSGEIAGVINLSNVVLGLFRSGYLGYYACGGHERQGL